MTASIRRASSLAALTVASLMFLGNVRAGVLINETFDDDAVDGLADTPSSHLGAVGQSGAFPPESTVQVAGPGGTYVDPFVGDATNHSYVIDNFKGGAAYPSPVGVQFPVVTWGSQFPGVVRDLTIEFDLLMKAENDPNRVMGNGGSDFWSYFEIRAGFTGGVQPSTVGDIVLWNSYRLQSGNPLVYNNGQNKSPDIASPIGPDRPMHIKYTIDGTTETWSLEIDGTPIPYNGTTSVPWAFGGPGAGVDAITFMSAFNLNTAEVYVDNLVVTEVPEPSTIVLLGLACVGLVAWRRRAGR